MSKIFIHEITQPNLVGVESEFLRADLMAITQRNPKLLVIDCSKVQMIDSTCLGIIILVSRMFNDKSRISLAGVDGLVKKVYHLTQMGQIISLYSSVEDALASFSAELNQDGSSVPIYTRSTSKVLAN